MGDFLQTSLTKERTRIMSLKTCEKLVQTGKGVQCSVQYITIWDTEYEDKPFEDCEYHWEIVGTEKVWAPIKDSCKKNPYDECHGVQKTHSKQVAYPVCHDVPREKCHYLDRKECYQVPGGSQGNLPSQAQESSRQSQQDYSQEGVRYRLRRSLSCPGTGVPPRACRPRPDHNSASSH